MPIRTGNPYGGGHANGGGNNSAVDPFTSSHSGRSNFYGNWGQQRVTAPLSAPQVSPAVVPQSPAGGAVGTAPRNSFINGRRHWQ